MPIMTMLDRPPPTPMSAARIRELYARHPSPERCASWPGKSGACSASSSPWKPASEMRRAWATARMWSTASTACWNTSRANRVWPNPWRSNRGASAANVGKGRACRPPRGADKKSPAGAGLMPVARAHYSLPSPGIVQGLKRTTSSPSRSLISRNLACNGSSSLPSGQLA